ncbi:MAG: GNAT family N-acetyltransferase [Coriobacteriia bacterium]|nr:GNAT family N-acetyltransferase [Coriobacteriia bacterium]
MRSHPRQADAAEAAALWPAVRADRVFESAEHFAAYRTAAPWRVRVAGRGEAAVLGVWREHLDVLALRGLWCSPPHVAAFLADAREVARTLGLARVLSPLLPVDLLGPYRREGMTVCQRVTAIQGRLGAIAQVPCPPGVVLRAGVSGDVAAIEALDARCFDDFWRYGNRELDELLSTERLVVAEQGNVGVIGYTLATASRGAATLGRLAVAPEARRRGVAGALVNDVACWADAVGAETLTLCTQEENAASRAFYAAMGLSEVRDVYGLAIGDVGRDGR